MLHSATGSGFYVALVEEMALKEVLVQRLGLGYSGRRAGILSIFLVKKNCTYLHGRRHYARLNAVFVVRIACGITRSYRIPHTAGVADLRKRIASACRIPDRSDALAIDAKLSRRRGAWTEEVVDAASGKRERQALVGDTFPGRCR